MPSIAEPLPRSRLLRAIATIALTFSSIAAVYAQNAESSKPIDQWRWRDASGKPAEETSGMKSNKGFSAMLVLADKDEAERFVREWNETPTEHAPAIEPAERAARGQSVVLLILYAGCSAKTEGPAPCTATFDLKVTNPEGKITLDEPGLTLARTQPAYPAIVQLSPMTLQTDFEPSDPDGVYRYDVVLRNQERNATIALTETIVLNPQAPPPPATP
jgi:hypothetical protein